MSTLNLKILFTAVDGITAPLKNIQKALSSTTTTLQNQQKAMQQLNHTQRDVSKFEKLQQKTQATAQSLNVAQAKVKALGIELKNTEKPTSQLTIAFGQAQKASNALQQQHTEERLKLAELNRVLKATGINTAQLSTAKKQLTVEETRLNTVLAEQARREATLQSYHAKKEAYLKRAKSLSIAGGVALGVGYSLKKPLTGLMSGVTEIDALTQHLKLRGVENIESLLKTAEQLTQSYAGITPTLYLEAANAIKTGMKGLSDEALSQLTHTMALTAKATGSMLPDTAERFSKTFTAFQLQSPNLNTKDFSERYSAGFSYLTHHLKASGLEMQQAMDGAGNSATNMGMSLLDQFATLGLLQQTLSASDAGQALRNFGLQAGKAEANFKTLADTSDNPVFVQLLNSEGKLRQLPLIFKDLRARYGETLDAFEQEELKTAFGNDDVLKFIHTLYPQMQQWLKVREDMGQAMAGGTGYTERLAQGLDNHIGGQWTKTQQRLNVLTESLGRALIPSLEHLLKIITPVIEKFTHWIEQNPVLAKNLGAIAIGIGALAFIMAPVLLTLGAMTAGVGLLTGALPKLAIGLRAVSAAGALLFANPIGIAILALTTGAILLIKYWEPVSHFFKSLWNTLEGFFVWMGNALKKAFENSPLPKLIQLWQPVLKFFETLISKIEIVFQAVKKVASFGMNIGSALLPQISPIFQKSTSTLEASDTALQKTEKTNIQNNISNKKQNNTAQNTWNVPITIHAVPGVDGIQLAQQIKSELTKIFKPTETDDTALFDPL